MNHELPNIEGSMSDHTPQSNSSKSLCNFEAVAAVIRARRTVHLYDKTEMSREVLLEALELGLLAPNHRFTFPWQFTVVSRDTRCQLLELALSLKLAEAEASDSVLSDVDIQKLRGRLEEKMLNPAALVVFGVRKHQDPVRYDEDRSTVACTIQNFTLALSARGYGSKWSSGRITRHPKTFELLSIDAGIFDIMGFIWVGTSTKPLPPRKRPPLADHVRFV